MRTVTVQQTVFALTTNVNGADYGTVLRDPAGDEFYTGTEVNLIPVAAPGWTFDHWEGSLTGSANPGEITVDANENVTAVFVCSGNYELATEVEGEGSVSLSPSGGSYACNAETTVTLTATEESGWTFDHWEGDASGSANPVDVEMTWHRYVKAVFVCTASYTLGTSTVGGGSVTLDPSGGTYSCGDQVNIIPVPDPGWAFSGWTGDLSGSDQPGKVKMDGNRSVTATFVTGYAVSTATVGEGTVVGGGSYPAGSTAKLKALPDVGWSFDGWSGDLSGLANPASLPMNGNKAVTATFVEVFPVTIIGGDTEAGSVAQVPPPRAFGTYETGTEVTLTATKETYTGKNKSNIDLGYDYVFSHWTGLPSAQFPTGPHGAGTSNSNPVTYEVVGPTTVEAVWTKRRCARRGTSRSRVRRSCTSMEFRWTIPLAR